MLSTSTLRRVARQLAQVLVMAVCLIAAASCAGSSSPPATAAGGASGAQSEAPTTDAPDATVVPPDGKWLVDEQGRSYYLTEVKRVEGAYKWVDETKQQVRVAYGLVFDVADYDDQVIHIKVYKPVPRVPQQVKQRPDPQQIAAEYAFTIPQVDRLQFQPFEAGLPKQGQWREGFAVADIDGDGFLDIVSGPARKTGSRPAIFLGDGAGHWRPWREAVFPPVPFDYGDAAVGDLNGDGRVDLVLASHLRGITAMVQEGKGQFRLWSKGIEFVGPGDPGSAGSAFSSRAIELVDWNADGRLDVVGLADGPQLNVAAGTAELSTGSNGVVIYLNNGDGTWGKIAGKARIYGDKLQVADIDGDGREDVFIGSSVQGFKSLLLRGRPDGSWEDVRSDAIRNKALVRGVAVGDLDHDGRHDVLVGYQTFEGGIWRTGVDALLFSADGFSRHPVLNAESMEGIWALALGDLDQDGNLDAVALTGGGEGWVLLGDGKGGFARQESSEIAQKGCSGRHVELVDLDHDGYSEIVAEFASESGSGMSKFLKGTEDCPSSGSLRVWKPVPKAR